MRCPSPTSRRRRRSKYSLPLESTASSLPRTAFAAAALLRRQLLSCPSVKEFYGLPAVRVVTSSFSRARSEFTASTTLKPRLNRLNVASNLCCQLRARGDRLHEDYASLAFRHQPGIAFGAGLYEARVVIPQWADIPPQSWPNTGLMFWVYVTTDPADSAHPGQSDRGVEGDGSTRRKWWLGACGYRSSLKRVATFSYFIPAMIGLTTSALPDAEVKATLSQWLSVQSRSPCAHFDRLANGAKGIVIARRSSRLSIGSTRSPD